MCIVWSQMFLILTPKNTKLSDVFFFFLPTLFLKNETQTSKKVQNSFYTKSKSHTKIQ